MAEEGLGILLAVLQSPPPRVRKSACQGAVSSQGDEAQGSAPALTASFVSSPTKGTSRTPGYFAVWPWGPCLHKKKESIRELILKF